MSQGAIRNQGGSGGSAITFVTPSGSATSVGGIVNLVDSGGTTISATGNTITVASSGGGTTLAAVALRLTTGLPSFTGDSVARVIPYDTVVKDNLSNWNSTTKTFTASVDAYYNIQIAVSINQNPNNQWIIYLLQGTFLLNSGQVFPIYEPISSGQVEGGTGLIYTATMNIHLRIGDTIQPWIIVGGTVNALNCDLLGDDDGDGIPVQLLIWQLPI